MKKLMVSVLSVLAAFALNADCCDVNYHFHCAGPKPAKVTIDDSFWTPRMRLWEDVTAYDVLKKQEPWMRNFDRVARGEKGTGEGPDFCDGHVYEAICGISDHLRFSHDERMKRKLDGLIARIAAAQAPDGSLPGIAPTAGWGYADYGTVWDGALVEVPETVYRFTGDLRVLRDFYPALRRSVDFRLAHQVRSNGTLDEGPGDWCPIATRTTNALVSTAWFCGTLQTAAKVAARLGEDADARRFDERAQQMKDDFNRAFYRGDGVYAGRTQTAQALALHFGLVPDSDRKAAERQLVAAVERANGHMDCGVLGSRTLFRALSEMGRTDLAYRLIVQPTPPSFGAWLKAGDTALREDFADGFSRCHVMFADFAAWANAYLGGIRDVEDGFERFTLAPETIDALDHVTVVLQTPRGEVRSHWERKDGRVSFRFTVPAGAKANVRFGGTCAEYGAGSYMLSCS